MLVLQAVDSKITTKKLLLTLQKGGFDYGRSTIAEMEKPVRSSK
jgi:hypothetical protein